jgi:hypothetical protein
MASRYSLNTIGGLNTGYWVTEKIGSIRIVHFDRAGDSYKDAMSCLTDLRAKEDNSDEGYNKRKREIAESLLKSIE